VSIFLASMILLLFSSFNIAVAETSVEVDKTPFSNAMNINQVLDYALENNPAILIAREQLQSQIYSEESAHKNQWPVVSANSSIKQSHSRIVDKTVKSSVGLSLSLPLYKGGSLGTERDTSTDQRLIAEFQMLRAEQSLIKDVKHAFIDIINAKKIHQEEKLSVERLKEHARISRIFFSEAQVWRNDVLQADVSVAQGEKQLITASNDVSRKKAVLNELLGRPIDGDLNVNGLLRWYDFKIPGSKASELLMDDHPDLQQALLNQKVASLAVETKKASDRPQLDFSMNYNAARETTFSEQFSRDVSGTLNVSWQLYNGGRTTKDIAAARSQYLKSGYELYTTRQQLTLSIKNALLELHESAAQVHVLKKALDSAEENYRVNTFRYQEQLGTAGDLLDSQDLLSQSRKDTINARARYLKSIESLHYEMATIEKQTPGIVDQEQLSIKNNVIKTNGVKKESLKKENVKKETIKKSRIKMVLKKKNIIIETDMAAVIDEAIKTVIGRDKKMTTEPIKKQSNRLETIDSSEQYVQMQPDDFMSIQLLALTSIDEVYKIIKQYNQYKDLYWLKTKKKNGQIMYALLYGSFADKTKAKQAYEALDESLKSSQPWIRTMKTIKKQAKIIS